MEFQYPCLQFDVAALRGNATAIHQSCAAQGLEFAAVTKAVGGNPRIAGTFLAGGAEALADSRIENLRKLRRAFSDVPLWLLRSPTPSQAPAAVAVASGSYQSQWPTLLALNAAAADLGIRHQVYILVEVGDLREGMMPEDATSLLWKARSLESLDLVGIAANMACFAGVKPSWPMLQRLDDLAADIERQPWWDRPPLRISAGNSSALAPLLLQQAPGRWPQRMAQIRIGESLFLGWDIFTQEPLPGLQQNTCILQGEVIEVVRKPSVPWGERGTNAFGETMNWPDRGVRRRALVALGRQEIGGGVLYPLQPGVEFLGATSDHVVLDVEEAMDIGLGSVVEFGLDYGSLLAASTAESVKKIFTDANPL